jgi:hypothetical protein
MLCEKCGRKISDDETLCAKCAKGMQTRETAVSGDSSSEASSSFYSHSGRINPLVLILGFPLVLIASIILSFVYAYAVVYIPILGYLSFLLTFGFVFGVGYSTAFILRFFKTRNTLFAAVFGLFSGIFALYAAWVTFEYVLYYKLETGGEDISIIKLALDPLWVWRIACNIAETGWYSIKDITPKGAVLWTFWAIEALAIVGCAVYMAHSFIKDMVFCEACNVWAESHVNKLEFEYLSENELKEKLSQGDSSFLGDLIKLKRTDSEFYRIIYTVCLSCNKLFTLSLFRITKSWDNEGKETEKKVPILQNLIISQELFERLTSLKKPEPAESEEESIVAADAAAQAEAEASAAEASEEGDAE